MNEISAIVEVLRRGGVMLYPTDTVWGIGCDACNEQAVAKIFCIKKRSPSQSLIVLVDGEAMLEQYVSEIPAAAKMMLHNATSPLTVIYSKGVGFAPNVCAATGSVAVRIAEHDFCKQVIGKLGRPIVSTSANLSGRANPATFADIAREVKEAVDVQVDTQWEGRQTRKPSTIVQLERDGTIHVIR